MKFQKPLLAATLLAASVSAQSATTDWGTHDNPAEVGFNFVKTDGSPTGFADLYTFVVAPGFKISGSSVVASNNVPFLNIAGGTYSLLGYGADNLLGTNDDSIFGTWQFSGATGSIVNLVTNAGPGKYLFTVSGIAAGSAGGAYLITSTVAPVPVPAAALLFSSGLAGLLFKRRRQTA